MFVVQCVRTLIMSCMCSHSEAALGANMHAIYIGTRSSRTTPNSEALRILNDKLAVAPPSTLLNTSTHVCMLPHGHRWNPSHTLNAAGSHRRQMGTSATRPAEQVAEEFTNRFPLALPQSVHPTCGASDPTFSSPHVDRPTGSRQVRSMRMRGRLQQRRSAAGASGGNSALGCTLMLPAGPLVTWQQLACPPTAGLPHGV